jgi:hypothetical protein
MLAQTLFVDSIIRAPGLNDGRRFRDPAPDIYAAGYRSAVGGGEGRLGPVHGLNAS